MSLPGFKLAAKQQGFSEFIGPFYESSSPEQDSITRALLIKEQHLNPEGVVHGGVILAFLDYVCYRAIGDSVGHDIQFATIQLGSEFLAAAKPGDILFGKAEITKTTRAIIFARGEIYTDQRIIMTGSGLWKILGQ